MAVARALKSVRHGRSLESTVARTTYFTIIRRPAQRRELLRDILNDKLPEGLVFAARVLAKDRELGRLDRCRDADHLRTSRVLASGRRAARVEPYGCNSQQTLCLIITQPTVAFSTVYRKCLQDRVVNSWKGSSACRTSTPRTCPVAIANAIGLRLLTELGSLPRTLHPRVNHARDAGAHLLGRPHEAKHLLQNRITAIV